MSRVLETRQVVSSREDLAGRLDDRNDDDVLTCWLKAIESRQDRKRVTPLLPSDSVTEGKSPGVAPGIRPAQTAAAKENPASLHPTFPRLNLAELLSPDRPPREWVVRGLIPAGTSVSIVAAAGTGKSLLVLAMSLAVARGDNDFAGYPISQRRRVFLIDMENTENDLADRFTSLGVTEGDADQLSGLILIHLPQLDGLDTAAGAQQLQQNLEAYELGAGDVVVLDSLQRVITGDENDADTLRKFYRHTGKMLKRLGITVIRTDNTGKDPSKGARGTSGKRDDVDIELILTRDARDHDRMTLTPGKSRLPDIKVARLTRAIDDTTGRLQYKGVGATDPGVDPVSDVIRALDALGVPSEAGEDKARAALKNANLQFLRKDVRAALKQRKSALA